MNTNMKLLGLIRLAGTSNRTGKAFDFTSVTVSKPHEERGGNVLEFGGSEAITVNLDSTLVQKTLAGRTMDSVIGTPVTLLFDQNRRPVLFQIGDTDDTATISEDTFNI